MLSALPAALAVGIVEAVALGQDHPTEDVEQVGHIGHLFFHKSIMESNPFTWAPLTKTRAQELGEAFLEEMLCSDIKCLEKRDFHLVVLAGSLYFVESIERFKKSAEAGKLLPWAPVLDGTLIKDRPLAAVKARAEITTPMLF